MKPVFLIGYMGCGKTTLGEPLARHMGLQFVDLDDYIERKYSMSAKEIFNTLGEPAFRRIESEALAKVATDARNVVVACGGGTPLVPANMELMNRLGITVWLQASVERIVSEGHVSPEGFWYADDAIFYRENGITTQLCDVHELNLLGRHNFENVMAAAAIVLPLIRRQPKCRSAKVCEIEDVIKRTSDSGKNSYYVKFRGKELRLK